MNSRRFAAVTSTGLLALALAAGAASVSAQQQPPQGAAPGTPGAEAPKPEFPPLDKAIEGLTKVVSTADGAKPLYDLYADTKTGRLVAVLPPNYEKQDIMIACTVAAGDPEAGVMGPTHYVRWERYDKQLALVAPDLFSRTQGDQQAKDSVAQLYTGRVLLATPIIAMADGNRPVIDLGSIATKNAKDLFGNSIFGDYGPDLPALNPALAKLTKVKAFPVNLVFEYQAPKPDGQIVRAAYSIGELSGTPGFKPRKADERFGYFYNWHADFAKEANQQVTERYISRWNLEKADPKLKVSPPKQPIVWHIEHTTPVKFRRYVREGIEMWNEAFGAIGFDGAVVVYQQDAATGAHMDKDPEDARYNFFRWNVSDQGYAIGPSRTNPYTGEILDADVVWHQGLTRAVRGMLENLSETVSTQSFGPETLAWLDEHPEWDPRVRLAPPERRDEILRERAAARSSGDGAERTRMAIGAGGAGCNIGELLAVDIGLADAAFIAGALDGADGDTLDGLPEEYLGQMIRYISAHEVGHCLGLQHNMIASTIRTLKEINSPGFSGATVGSVMDYVAANINHELGEVQGPYATPVLGPYDHWVIAYGYGPEDQLDKVRARVGEPDVVFQSQIAISFGGDPRNNTWDMGADNLEFARSRLSLVKKLRANLLDKVVKEGEPWAMARRRYNALLATHVQALSISARWIGGTFYSNDFKGDPGDRAPISDVPADRQRLALKMVIDHSFNDDAFGLTPDLVRYFAKEHFYDPANINELLQDHAYTVHDLVGGIQATALTFVMNPTTLRRVYDNEFRATENSPLTLSEVVTTVTDAAWTECANPARGNFTAASPMVSSFRRNLQREHVGRLITLALLDNQTSPSLRTISTLAVQELKRIDKMAEAAQRSTPDPYTSAHLDDVRTRIARAMDTTYTINR